MSFDCTVVVASNVVHSDNAVRHIYTPYRMAILTAYNISDELVRRGGGLSFFNITKDFVQRFIGSGFFHVGFWLQHSSPVLLYYIGGTMRAFLTRPF